MPFCYSTNCQIASKVQNTFRVSIKRHDLSKSLPNRCSTEKVIFVKNELEFNLFISADSIEAAKARRKKVLIIFASMLNLPPVNEILN